MIITKFFLNRKFFDINPAIQTISKFWFIIITIKYILVKLTKKSNQLKQHKDVVTTSVSFLLCRIMSSNDSSLRLAQRSFVSCKINFRN